MPYCWKCGAELPEDAEFCSACGTAVAPPKAERERRPIIPIAIVVPLVAILVIAAVGVTVVFLPVRSVDISESRDVPYQIGIDTVNVGFTAYIASVNVVFEQLEDRLVTLDVSATGWVGVLVSPDVLDLTFDYTTAGNILTVTAGVDIEGPRWLGLSWLHITCDLRVDPSVNAGLEVKTSTGGIVMDTRAGVVLNALSLETITGGVEANLVTNVVVAGDVSVKATTGGVEFSWDNVIVTKDVLVNAKTTTGGVDLGVKQYGGLLGSVTLDGETTTGGVDFAIEIRGDVGARIESGVTTGGIDVEKQVKFTGTRSQLESENYPASNNFDVSLKTTTGGIDITAEYTP